MELLIFCLRFLFWQCKEECASLADLRLYPDSAGIHANDLFCNREAYTDGFNFFRGRKRLKYLENLFKLFLSDSWAIVGDAEFPKTFFLRTTDFDPAFFLVHILYSITYQVMKDLSDVCLFAHQNRQFVLEGYFNIFRWVNFTNYFGQHFVQV